ncbi:MAG: MMPL family transporter [Gemmatimonadales bacterium]
MTIVLVWVDLTPRVEAEFFFSRDDPQYVASAEIAGLFPTGSQIIIRAAATDVTTADYRSAIAAVGEALSAIEGVAAINSIANRDAFESPLWGRVLIAPDERATNLLVDVSPDASNSSAFISEIENVTAQFDRPEFELVVSGVPYVIEHIRRNLLRDLTVFSTVAIVVFATIVAIVYRAAPIVLGTLTACLGASSLTLIVTQLVGGSIGLLTANIATIVFVLTLSHIVFLTSNWKQCRADVDSSDDPVKRAVAMTVPASFWCMLTTLLGFASLFLASAKPLRQLGLAGAIGTATAIVVAYTLYPPFLKLAPYRPAATWQRMASSALSRLDGARYVAGFLILAVVAAFGVLRVETDPDLLSYFATNDPLREGLEAVDRDGGSSPLNIVVRNTTGERIDNRDTVDRMWDLHLALESDPSVGSVVSPALILAEARNAPFVGRLPPAQLLDLLQVTPLRATIAAYIHPNRQQGLYFLRMHEAGRSETRDAVIDRLVARVHERQLEPVLVGGLYEQQGQLGKLIASSLRLGLGGLITLFLGIAFYVSRDARVTAAMVFSLAGIPLIVLGAFGYLNSPIDIISSPAANVALAMGVDSMIHLMMRARRRRLSGSNRIAAWTAARDELWQPIVGAAFIISAGFGIFSLSTFPPTQKFGLAVILGTVAAAATALLVLPQAAAGRLTATDDAKALEVADPPTSPQ